MTNLVTGAVGFVGVDIVRRPAEADPLASDHLIKDIDFARRSTLEAGLADYVQWCRTARPAA